MSSDLEANSDLRVRFAPSPTGTLHIGGVRTALYAWLWARQHGGTFVLRIEDTDAERSTEASVRVIFEAMEWLGLSWDEGPTIEGGARGDFGPYRQTERMALYRERAEALIASGAAYRCYATREEIQAAREAYELKHGKRGFRFRSPYRDRRDGDPERPHVVRFRAPSEGATGWTDLVYGEVSYPNAEQQDFVLLRENGLPLYNFGCFVDDSTMRISLVTRGDDHLVNTPQQLLLYQAAQIAPPQFAHLPMVLGPDGKKLSKRHAAVSVLEYRDMGYLPEAILNYLARLGWSHGDEELFSREELIAKFSWDSVGKTGSRYDTKKLNHVQSHHLHSADNVRLAQDVVPFLAKNGVDIDGSDPLLPRAIAPVKLRATTLADLAEGLDYFFRPAPVRDEKAARKFLKPEALPVLEALITIVDRCDPFSAEALERAITEWMHAQALTMKQVAPPARVALTGRAMSPGLYETIALIGKERALSRLRRAVSELNEETTGEATEEKIEGADVSVD